MSVTVEELIRQALKLDPKARAELAALILESLPTESAEEVDAAWEAEIRRRVQQLESGSVKTIPWEEVRERLIRSEGDA
jgi:putative addiction module component (TIGR02574 family)